ncbi:hypothetical protein [uncultured Aquabacterium sp.]|uniref:hypothetical protein n=1 Tax=uncultured Aquabacterium sp. TaxID=158753 RepID=UPI00262605FA|nr:hypothetical protein [uncultured Aquabacterium sp.]
MNTHLQDVAYGRKKADRVIINGQFVNVHSREIYPGGVAIAGERVAAIGDVTYTIGPDTEVIDAEGHYIVPGFVEGHIHPESSCLSIDRFAEVVASHGTTSVFTDLHEIGVVTGMEGIDAALAGLYAVLCGNASRHVGMAGANGLAGRCLSLDMRR